jgi:malonyl-CoA O-methyltransferase
MLSKESKVIKQFSRFADQYNTYSIIQAEVAKVLVEKISKQEYSTILDLGCGSGEIYKNIEKINIDFKKFIAVDSSEEMLILHPSNANIYKYHVDFDNQKGFNLPDEDILLVSSSALQWSKDLDLLLTQLSKQASIAYFAIFTSNTFKTLHKTANLLSPIYPEQTLKAVIDKYYDASFEVNRYQLEFETVRDMFKYIKKSGVSGGEKQLNYKQIKALMYNYPLNYLEFEVLFVEATSLTKI